MRDLKKSSIHYRILIQQSNICWGFCKFLCYCNWNHGLPLCFCGCYCLLHFLLILNITYHVPRFHAVCHMDMESGFLSLDNFRTAMSSIQRQPKMEYLQGLKNFFDCYTFLACVSSLVFPFLLQFSSICLLLKINCFIWGWTLLCPFFKWSHGDGAQGSLASEGYWRSEGS